MIRIILTSIFLSFCIFTAFASDGYKIKVTFSNYKGQYLYLGYHLADKQYIKDTVQVNGDGEYIFQADTLLDAGMYLVVLPSKNYFQIIVDNDQQFSIQADTNDFALTTKIKGDEQNTKFFEYLNFLNLHRPEIDAINAAFRDTTISADKRKKLEDDQKNINGKVREYQLNIIKNNPKWLLSAIIKSTIDPDLPDLKGTDEEIQKQRYIFSKEHWFDNVNLGDDRLLRTPILFQKISYYIEKLTPQIPDSINQSIDTILTRLEPAKTSYRYFLVHFLNSYAQSKFVGMDAVYVYLAENYYAKKKAPWTDEQDLLKIIDNARRLKPLLIGKIAPDILMQRRDGSEIALHDVKSEYTILLFWKPDCGHCKKEMPALDSIYNELKALHVEVFAVCVKLKDDTPKCWEFIDEHKFDKWMNLVDPLHKSGFYTIYDVTTTPMLYLLDEKKEIISKRLGVHQLLEVIPKLQEIQRNKKKEAGEKKSKNGK